MRRTQASRFATILVGATIAAATACGQAGDPAAPPKGGGPAIEPEGGAAGAGPTWFRDIEPLVQARCDGCHVAKGTGGFPLDQPTAVSLAKLVAERVASGYMPPWPPSKAGVALRDSRALAPAEVALFVAWAAAGAPLGDPATHAERPPIVPALPVRPFDLELTMPEIYRGPSTRLTTDEVRCFVLALPARADLADGASVIASQWRAQNPVGIHSLSGVPLDAAAAATARALENQDGRAGFECAAGFGAIAHGPPLGANGTGAAADGSTLPEGTRVVVPAGGAVLMRVHYAVQHLAGALDRSSLRLWLASPTERAERQPLGLVTVEAPVELPCPAGIPTAAGDPCSRAGAFARFARAPATAASVEQRQSELLTACGTSAAALTGGLAFGAASPTHFVVPTSCAATVAKDSVVHVVHGRMKTYGTSMRIESENDDGTWLALLDIPAWRWAWDGAYVLESGVPVKAGRRLRVSCTHDNGAYTQWSALSGEPGHDGPALPPQLPAQYLVSADHRAAESCVAYLGVTTAP